VTPAELLQRLCDDSPQDQRGPRPTPTKPHSPPFSGHRPTRKPTATVSQPARLRGVALSVAFVCSFGLALLEGVLYRGCEILPTRPRTRVSASGLAAETLLT
jgi:hypothetical protein